MLFRKKNKIAIIGSSHITSLKRYTDSSDYKNNLKLTFFGGPGVSLRLLKADKDRLVTNDKNLKKSLLTTSGDISDFIDSSSYNAFYLHGLLSGSNLVKTIINIDNHFATGGFLSQALIEEIFNELIQDTLLHNIILKLRKVTDKPIFVSSAPLPSELITKTQKTYRIDDNRIPHCEELLNAFERLLSIYLSSHEAHYLSLPSASKSRAIFTINDYMSGSKPLHDAVLKSQAQHDLIHANASYGKLLIKALEKAI